MPQTMANALFGPIFVATTPPIAYFVDYNYIYYKCQLASKKMKEEKKNSLMAQTMHLALFGPIFVAATPLIVYFIDYIYIYTKCYLFSKKIRKKKKLTCHSNDM